MTSSREHSSAGSPHVESPVGEPTVSEPTVSEPTVSELRYADLDIPLTGVLVGAQDTNSDANADTDTAPAHGHQRPGLLLVHGGAGLDAHAREQAVRYARLGYVVLACDIFGPGAVAGDRAAIVDRITALRDDPAALARRAGAGLAALAARPEVDARRVAALGFCFGGMTALTLARSGADLAAAVSMHGSLATTAPAAPGAVTASVLVCHGAADPHVPLSDVEAFGREMEQAGADWQLVMYGGAQHGFTHRDAVPGAIPGVVYDPAVDELSFAAARDFLDRAFERRALPA